MTLRPERGLWQHSDFLKLWSAETVSQFGTQFSALALPLTAVIVLHASVFEIAALNVVEFLPFVLVSLPAGVWVDRLPRRPILVLGDLARAGLLDLDPDRVRIRRADDLAALCGGLPRRDRDRLLRRRLPVVSARARRPAPARRRELEAGDQPLERAARRAGSCRGHRRPVERARCDRLRRRQLPRLGAPHLPDPQGRAAPEA